MKPAVEPRPQEKPSEPGNTPVTSAGQPVVENTEGASPEPPEEAKAKTDAADDASAEVKTETGNADEPSDEVNSETDSAAAADEAGLKQLKEKLTDANEASKEDIEYLKKVGGSVCSAHSMMKRAKEVFNMYPGLQECYFTADETAFTEKQHAVMHGHNLDVSEVITIKRSEE